MQDGGQLKPSSIGIMLNAVEWEHLVEALPDLQAALGSQNTNFQVTTYSYSSMCLYRSHALVLTCHAETVLPGLMPASEVEGLVGVILINLIRLTQQLHCIITRCQRVCSPGGSFHLVLVSIGGIVCAKQKHLSSPGQNWQCR